MDIHVSIKIRKMTFKHEMISTINDYIRRKATGTPNRFAEKLGISRSNLDRCIRFMREHDAPIRYDHIDGTYYYEEDGNFEIGFRPKGELYDPVIYML